MLRGLAELPAQPRHVHVDGLVRSAVGQPPDVGEQVTAGHHLPGPQCQIVQEVELAAAEVERRAVQGGLMPVRVQPQPADRQQAGRPGSPGAARRSTARILASISPGQNSLTT